MILYTEEQLKYAYEKHIKILLRMNRTYCYQVAFPTLEEFREIYEEELTQKYKEQNNGL